MNTVNKTSDSTISGRKDSVHYERTGSFELSKDGFEGQSDTQPPLLPRQAWKSQLAFLKVLFRAKQALDQAEKAVDQPWGHQRPPNEGIDLPPG